MVEVADGDDRPIVQKRDSRVATRGELGRCNKLVVRSCSTYHLLHSIKHLTSFYVASTYIYLEAVYSLPHLSTPQFAMLNLIENGAQLKLYIFIDTALK